METQACATMLAQTSIPHKIIQPPALCYSNENWIDPTDLQILLTARQKLSGRGGQGSSLLLTSCIFGQKYYLIICEFSRDFCECEAILQLLTWVCSQEVRVQQVLTILTQPWAWSQQVRGMGSRVSGSQTDLAAREFHLLLPALGQQTLRLGMTQLYNVNRTPSCMSRETKVQPSARKTEGDAN